jgi:hypothetical protein
MTYITSGRRARLLTQLATVQAQIESANAAYLSLTGSTTESYSFDSGEGSQRTTRKKSKDLLDEISALEAKESHIINELNNIGIIAMRLRRK